MKINTLVSEKEIDERIEELAREINRDYEGQKLVLVCILKGGVVFMVKLAQKLEPVITMDFMSVSSYGNEHSSSGVVKIKKDLDESIEGKNVIIVEDIIDSGRTLALLRDMLLERNPASLKICTLLDKPSRRTADIKVDYVGFEIPDKFVLGYGLDYDQEYRNLPYVGVVEGDE